MVRHFPGQFAYNNNRARSIRLEEIWTIMFDTGSVPEQWLQVRAVAIDKEDGGDRWLSIAASMWRLGMSVAIRGISQ